MATRRHARPVVEQHIKPTREEIILNIKALDKKLRSEHGDVSIVGHHEDGTPIVEGKHGGKQSFLPYRTDLLDGFAILRLAAVLHHGSRYGIDNWRKIPRQEHLNHAIVHLMNVLSFYHPGPNNTIDDINVEEELEHAFCRVMMAVATDWDRTEKEPE